MKVVAVIPALREEATIGAVVRAVAEHCDAVVVVDGASDDETVLRARDAGADVLIVAKRGYGRACIAGTERAVALGADVVAFVDGGGAEEPADLAPLLAPILEGRADLVVGSRVRGLRERGALRPAQRLGNALATRVLARRHHFRFSDLGSMRAVRARDLGRLALVETGSGWPLEMQARALLCGLRVTEVPIHYRRRRAGRSKVSGSLVGSARAAVAMLRVLARTSP